MTQTFCIYCQKDYYEPQALQTHLRRVHLGTYAQINLAPLKKS